MLGPIGSSLMSILKVLSPSEIEQYSKDGVVGEVHHVSGKALAVGSELFDLEDSNASPSEQFKNLHKKKESKAKILPFKKDEESVEVPEEDPYRGFPPELSANEPEEKQSQNNDVNKNHLNAPTEGIAPGNSELETLGIYSGQKIKKFELEKRKSLESQQDSASIFLLKQRKKLMASKIKLVEQDALENYRKSNHEIRKKENIRDNVDEDFNEDQIPEEKSSSLSSGILFNKKAS